MAETLYQQVMINIKQKIIAGKYPDGTKLPSEPKLQNEYSVSRVTLRNALNQLVKGGYIIRVQGKGTFVNKPKKVKRLIRHAAVESFSEIARQNGFEPTTSVISVRREKPLEKMSTYIPGDALNVVRVRSIDGSPLIVENNFFPLPRFENLSQEDLSQSLYQTFEFQYGIKKIISKETTVSMIEADLEKAKLLNCSIGFPLFLLDTVITDKDGEIVQAAEEFILSNMYQFEI